MMVFELKQTEPVVSASLAVDREGKTLGQLDNACVNYVAIG